MPQGLNRCYLIYHVTAYVTNTREFHLNLRLKTPLLLNLDKKKELTKHFYLVSLWWLKTDSNHRPAGYEPDALAS